MLVMKKQSKKEKLIYENVEILHSVVELLNKHKNYVFVGSFANIGHKHFRGSWLFELIVQEEVAKDIFKGLVDLGLDRLDKESEHEFYSKDILFKVQISDNEGYFKDVVKVEAEAFNRNFTLQFPSLDVHINHLKKLGDFLSLEDIRLISSVDSFDRDIFNESINVELYLSMMFLGINKHNHSNGSYSCRLCKQVDINRRGVE